ncbi:MAG: phosphatidylserine decarboxylase family protein [Verrucomicrobia bacterium]|nr:MAG: phosphatidylserine decarboxylase family protein [Verrucomicrobiota bacterium]
MKHSGKARKAALRLVLLSLVALGVLVAIGFLASVLGKVIVACIPILVALWFLFAAFTLYFFRDPEARVPPGTNLVLSPGHGKIDVMDTATERDFMGGECQRLSMFLSVIDVHVQNAPVTGKIAFFKHTPGRFLSALKTESATHNENVLLGFEASEPKGQKVGVRLIAGVLARRIVPFVQQGEEVTRGQRISLIQFGSRADVYLPLRAKVKVKLNDHVVGGETVLAEFE